MVQAVSLLLLTLFLGISVPSDKAVANPHVGESIARKIHTTGVFVPPEDGPPGRREGGGTR